MKFLDYPEFAELSRQLTFESTECKVFTRLEAYSCKAVKRERQLFKSLETQYLQSASLSPPNHLDEMLASPFGRLDQSSARKTMFLLIATLNAAFPDHDFTDVNPADFRKESSSDSVLASLGTTLLSLRSNSNAPRSFSSYPGAYDGDEAEGNMQRSRHGAMGNPTPPHAFGNINHPQLASALDDVMDIADCEVYTFHPDADSDPHACAEPDEEGDVMDDDRYADDEGDITDDELANSIGEGETRSAARRLDRDQSYDDDSMGDEDAPMFDEDLLGSGFTPVHSRVSSNVTTPRTPSTSIRSRAGDYFHNKVTKPSRNPKDKNGQFSASMPTIPLGHHMRSAFALHDEDMADGDAYTDSNDDEDDDSGLHGLLWATYAFFYNKKLKRVLFVSVWSRRNTSHLPVSYSFSPPSYPVSRSHYSNKHLVAEKNVPAMSLDEAVMSAMRKDRVQAPQTDLQTPSPAKRAIARSMGKPARGRGRRGSRGSSESHRQRSASGSPAPSSLSPFPHVTGGAQQQALSEMGNRSSTPPANATRTSAQPIAVRLADGNQGKKVRPRSSREGGMNIAAALDGSTLSPGSSSFSSVRSANQAFSTSAKRAGESLEVGSRDHVGSVQKQRRT